MITSAPNGCCMLRIERTAARLAGLEVEQRRHHGRGAEVVGDRVAARRRVARLDVDRTSSTSTAVTCQFAVAQRLAEPAHHFQRDAQLYVVHRLQDPLEVRGLVLERRLRQLEVALLHGRPEDHVAPDAGQRGFRARLQRRHLDDEVLAAACARQASRHPAFSSSVENARGSTAAIACAARRDPHLALLARAVAAAGRVDRDAVPARAVEQRRAGRDAGLLDGAVGLLEDAAGRGPGARLEHGLAVQARALAAAACFLRYAAIQRDAPLVVAEQEVGRPAPPRRSPASARP